MFQITSPRKVIFGVGTFGKLGQVCSGLGRKTLLVTGRSALRKSGRLDRAVEMFRVEGIAVELFEGVENDPGLDTASRAIEQVRRSDCDMVISIGGGSAIDIGKIVAAMVPQSYTVYDFFESQIVEKTPLPFVALPTTAGTGSECTTVSVLTDTKNQVKKGVRNEKMTPLIALVDPGLTLNVPPDVTAQSGMDALTQAIEALVSRDANPISDALAIRGIELLHRHLPAAVSDGGRIENREPVALGSMITGMAFASAGLGAVHGLAHPIGALCHAPHGLICAVLLPHVCAFNQPAAPDKFNCIAGGMGLKSGIEVASAIMALNRRVGIPERLGKHGLTESLIPAIIPASRSGSMAKNPRNPTDEELREILMKVV